MKTSYPYTSNFFDGALSAFDIGATLQNKKIIYTARGLSFDIEQLSDDQIALIADYKKATDKIMQEYCGDNIE